MDEDGPQAELGAVTPETAARRRLAGTFALSALMHVALLVTIGASGSWKTRNTQAPVLSVRLMEVHEPAPIEPHRLQASALATPATAAQALPAEPIGNSAPTTVESAVTDLLPAPAALPALESPAAALAMVATTGESARAITVTAPPVPDPDAEPPAPHVAPEALARRIGAWVQELESSDRRRAELSWQHEGRLYTALMTRHTASDETEFDRYDVEIVTPTDSGSWSVGLSLRRVAFSHFTQFVDRWDSEVQLHDDEIAGRFHANSPIVIGYDRDAAPRFLGKVTTSARGFRIADASGRRERDEIFRAGLETGVERIALPREPDLPIKADDWMDGHRRSFARNTRIRFHADGSFGWSESEQRSPWQIEEPSDSPVYLVAKPGAELFVSGTVRGQVLVYAPERIVIEGDLRYARDPRHEQGSDDMLGLVTDGRVEIAPPHVTGRRDLEIQAAIYARRRFVVTRIDAPRAGTLRIYGSLTAGTLSATEPRYATRIDFDPRFEKRRPPGFPMTPRFELESADAAWRLE